MKHLSNTLNHFWRRWRREYLAELRESHRHLLRKCQGSPHISIGDLVVVHDESLPRGSWKLGRVRNLIVGRDGQTRGATVSVAGKNRQATYLNRPLQLLYPLELRSPEPVHADTPQETEEETSHQTADTEARTADADACASSRTRPSRAAAKKGEERRRRWIRELEDQEI